MDGIYAGRNRQAQSPFFDLARVEVLRGPQGALFGKNTAAGAISIVSAGPTSTFQGAVTGLYNFNQEGLRGHWLRLRPDHRSSLGARLAVRFLDEDGYIKNHAERQRRARQQACSWRASRCATRVDNFDYPTKVEYANRSVRGRLQRLRRADRGQNPGDTATAPRARWAEEGTKDVSWLSPAPATWSSAISP